MKCFRNESSSPSPSLELIAKCVLQEQQQSADPLVQIGGRQQGAYEISDHPFFHWKPICN
jgi:hypothetical protein